MTKANKENPEENLQKENHFLKQLINLREEGYYRQQVLLMMERQALAMEYQANQLAEVLNFLKESENEVEVNEPDITPKN